MDSVLALAGPAPPAVSLILTRFDIPVCATLNVHPTTAAAEEVPAVGSAVEDDASQSNPPAVVPSVAGFSVTVPTVNPVAVIVGVPNVELLPGKYEYAASASPTVMPISAPIVQENAVPLVVSIPFCPTGVSIVDPPVGLNLWITPSAVLPVVILEVGLASPLCHAR